MCTICGADCSGCAFKANCGGCCATGGKPFGGSCVAAEYIKTGGKEAWEAFKTGLTGEINILLDSLDIPHTQKLYELPGRMVNLEYPLPGGAVARLLDDSKVYLGCQIELGGCETCFGVVADTTFILICSYGCCGSHPQILLYKKR